MCAATPVTTILLCDDVPQLRTLLRFVFDEHPDLQVVGEAGDARSGVEEARRVHPDVVVLDLSMPGIDGLEAIPLFLDAVPEVTLIVFSGFTAERLAVEALQLGAHRYLEKGEDLDAVVAAVRDAVAERRAG